MWQLNLHWHLMAVHYINVTYFRSRINHTQLVLSFVSWELLPFSSHSFSELNRLNGTKFGKGAGQSLMLNMFVVDLYCICCACVSKHIVTMYDCHSGIKGILIDWFRQIAAVWNVSDADVTGVGNCIKFWTFLTCRIILGRDWSSVWVNFSTVT